MPQQLQTGDAAAPPELRLATLMANARQEAGLDDFGDDRFIEPLSRFLEAAATEARLSPMGVFSQVVNVQRLLVNRLRFEADLKRRPEILDEQVVRPIIILGLPRTGTTKLQRMLSRDPNAQALLFWRLLNPAPLPDPAPDGQDPRITVAATFLELLTTYFPDFMAAHPTLADEPDEEVPLLEMSFDGVGTGLRLNTPAFLDWVMQRPKGPSFEYMRHLLQYLQWQDGGGRGRHWVLKSPLHLGLIETVAEVFPDATFVHCHRDPVTVIPSFCGLLETAWRMSTDTIDLAEIGALCLRFWAEETDKYLAQRPAVEAHQPILDVGYAEIAQDSLAVIRRIYQHRGETMTGAAEAAITAWEDEFPQHRFGRHEYSLERYGLHADEVAEAFSTYRSRFFGD